MDAIYFLGKCAKSQVQEMTTQPIFSPLLIDMINDAVFANDISASKKPSIRRFVSEHAKYLLDSRVATLDELVNKDSEWMRDLVQRLNHSSHCSVLVEYVSTQVNWLKSKQTPFFWAKLIEHLQEGHIDFTWFGTEQLFELELQEFHPLAICSMLEEHRCSRRTS